MGYNPKIDKDGDITMRYQLKQLYFMITDNEEEQFVSLYLSQFYKIEDGEVINNLVLCNNMTQDVKFVKFFIDRTHEYVTACCDFFYYDEQSLESNIKKSLEIFSITRTAYMKRLKEMSV